MMISLGLMLLFAKAQVRGDVWVSKNFGVVPYKAIGLFDARKLAHKSGASEALFNLILRCSKVPEIQAPMGTLNIYVRAGRGEASVDLYGRVRLNGKCLALDPYDLVRQIELNKYLDAEASSSGSASTITDAPYKRPLIVNKTHLPVWIYAPSGIKIGTCLPLCSLYLHSPVLSGVGIRIGEGKVSWVFESMSIDTMYKVTMVDHPGGLRLKLNRRAVNNWDKKYTVETARRK
jgi:hypothetical protein